MRSRPVALLTALVGLSGALAACVESATEPSQPLGVPEVSLSNAVAAASAKVAVCHLNKDGSSRRVDVAPNTVARHLAHGDGTPNSFAGTWHGGVETIILEVSGTDVTARFAAGDRFGKLIDGGCALDIELGDGQTHFQYRGWSVNGACTIQWSNSNSIVVDPTNTWDKEACLL